MAALHLIQQDLAHRSGLDFWRPERLRRLVQLALFEGALPRWATSRWILAQAAQHLDPRTRSRFLRALQVAIETRGVESLTGVDERDARVKVMDHDWVFRQLWLYELGALEHFVRRVASPDLLAGADHIDEWSRAPMGAFRLVSESSRSSTLLDLGSGDQVSVINMGSTSRLEEGDCAIGRLVPIAEGAMFESAPLSVPDQVADQVADQPGAWVAAVRAGCHAPKDASPQLVTTVSEFGMLTDVPRVLQLDLALQAARRRGAGRGPRDPAVAGAALVREAVRSGLPEVVEDVKAWPMVAAWILEPDVFLALVGTGLGPDDVGGLLRLADLLVGPAAWVCRGIAQEVAAAA